MAQRGITAKIDLVELEKLSSMQATDEEIGAFFGVSARTILRRKRVKKFAEVMERGRAKGRLSIRRLQIKLLEQGNATMGVWLGKQILGQTDHYDVSGGSQIMIVVPSCQGEAADRANDADSAVTIDIGPDRALLRGD
jgi:hypothetical protein